MDDLMQVYMHLLQSNSEKCRHESVTNQISSNYEPQTLELVATF